jgi:cell wall hydrolase
MLEDLDTMSRTVYGEARNQSYFGQVAVAWVIKNRSFRPERFGSSIKDVCLRPLQFSCWNVNDPNRAIIIAATLDAIPFLRAYSVSALVILGDVADPTGGADHYHAAGIQPFWANSMHQTCQIGAHIFYKEH